jgi:hypothetical protein
MAGFWPAIFKSIFRVILDKEFSMFPAPMALSIKTQPIAKPSTIAVAPVSGTL